jgi:hypothetical protein
MSDWPVWLGLIFAAASLVVSVRMFWDSLHSKANTQLKPLLGLGPVDLRRLRSHTINKSAMTGRHSHPDDEPGPEREQPERRLREILARGGPEAAEYHRNHLPLYVLRWQIEMLKRIGSRGVRTAAGAAMVTAAVLIAHERTGHPCPPGR